MGLRIVAEGIEDAETLELLADCGCDIAQGFCISQAEARRRVLVPGLRPGPDGAELFVATGVGRPAGSTVVPAASTLRPSRSRPHRNRDDRLGIAVGTAGLWVLPAGSVWWARAR